MKLSLGQQRLAGGGTLLQDRRMPCTASRHISCSSSSASTVTVEAPTASQQQTSGTPSSWPSAAARAVAYSTVCVEEAANTPAAVTGRLPPWLKGQLLRNGPGCYDGMKHLFDGYSLLLKLDIDGASNSVSASHRFLQSQAYRHFKASGGKMKWREVGTPVPHESVWHAVADVAQTLLGVLGLGDGVTDNASVSIVQQAGRCYALTETLQGTYQFDPDTLETLGRVQYTDGMKGDVTTAHPTVLPNGDIINFVTTVGGGFTLYRQPASDPTRRQKLATLPHRRLTSPSWIHDFPASQNYMVIPEMPIYMNLGLLMTNATNEYMFMDWKPEDGSLIHVVSLDGKQVKSYRAPTFFTFHFVNAFESEDGRYLHLDSSVYQDATVIGDLYLDPVRAEFEGGQGISPSKYMRLTLDLHAPSGSEVAASWEHLVQDDSSYGQFFEFPDISPERRGQPYRYAYAACATRPTNAANSLGKFDNQLRSCKVWHEPGSLVGEPTFVPAPGATAEDEGVVLSVLGTAEGKAALLVLDGQSWEEVARAELPYGLPNGFHGTFQSA